MWLRKGPSSQCPVSDDDDDAISARQRTQRTTNRNQTVAVGHRRTRRRSGRNMVGVRRTHLSGRRYRRSCSGAVGSRPLPASRRPGSVLHEKERSREKLLTSALARWTRRFTTPQRSSCEAVRRSKPSALVQVRMEARNALPLALAGDTVVVSVEPVRVGVGYIVPNGEVRSRREVRARLRAGVVACCSFATRSATRAVGGGALSALHWSMRFRGGSAGFRLCEEVCARVGADVGLTFCNAQASAAGGGGDDWRVGRLRH